MVSKNYINYLSTGEKVFPFDFQGITDEHEIEVFKDTIKQKFGTDYIIDNLSITGGIVSFYQDVGAEDEQIMITIRQNLDIERQTELNNITEIRSENLNKEFDNLINIQQYLKNDLTTTVKNYSEKEIILPNPSEGKSLLWDYQGNLINSQENLSSLITQMEQIRNDIIDNAYVPDISDRPTFSEVNNLITNATFTLKQELQAEIYHILFRQIGDIYIQYLNTKKDLSSFIQNNFEYLLLDGREILRKNYPDLADFLGIDPALDHFNLPEFKNGTIRNLEKGNSRNLGTYEEDALQNITGQFGSLPHQTDQYPNGAFGIDYEGGSFMGYVAGNFYSLRGIDFNASRVARTDSETRMKNTSVQFYIKAKVVL